MPYIYDFKLSLRTEQDFGAANDLPQQRFDVQIYAWIHLLCPFKFVPRLLKVCLLRELRAVDGCYQASCEPASSMKR